MNIRKFEELVTAKKMKIEKRIKFLDQEIFICEGYSGGDRDCSSPHYKTMFSIADDPEHLTVGEFFTTEIVFPIKSKDVRMQQAEERAKQFLKDMRAECPK